MAGLYYGYNVWDCKLKPLSPSIFNLYITAQRTKELIQGYRNGSPKEKSKFQLPVLVFQGTLNEELYNLHKQECKEKGCEPENSKQDKYMITTTWLQIDLDHCQEPVEQLYEKVRQQLENMNLMHHLIFAHRTPSGEGLRLIIERTQDMMSMQFEEAKALWLRMMQVDYKSDSACSNWSRGSFCPMQEDIFFIDTERFFSPQPMPKTDFLANEVKAQTTTYTPELSAETYPDNYEGISFAQIVDRLIPFLDGSVAEGGRHTLVKGLANHLRYLCENNPKWLAQIIPTMGLPMQEYNKILVDMCTYPQMMMMPKLLRKILSNQLSMQDDNWPAPDMPVSLPPALQHLVSLTPENMKAAVAMAVFPALGTHLQDVKFHYADNVQYEPAFMNLLISAPGTGKSSVNTPIDCINADIQQRDEKNLQREREWREKVASVSSSKDKPQRPKGLRVQCLMSDVTNAALVKRLKEAEGYPLYIRINELEQLSHLSGTGDVNEIIKLAFDRSMYGQDRVGIDSVNERAVLRLNWNASTTPAMAQNFFKQNTITDGTLSRVTCCTIPVEEDDWGEEIPVYGTYGSDFTQHLEPYIQRLNDSSGIFNCTEAIEWAKKMQRQMAQYVREMDNKEIMSIVKRGVLSGFYRAMVLYILDGQQWTTQTEEFATWSVEYDFWCKCLFFNDMFEKAKAMGMRYETKSDRSYLDKLPPEFSKEHIMQLRPGVAPQTIGVMIRQWKFRGYISYNATTDMYVKTNKCRK